MIRAGGHRTGDVWSIQLRSVVNQVGADEVTGRECADERQLSGKNRSSDDPGELLGVLPRVGGMSTFDSQELEHSLLGSEDSATTHSPNLNARHGDGHQEVFAIIGSETMRGQVEFR